VKSAHGRLTRNALSFEVPVPASGVLSATRRKLDPDSSVKSASVPARSGLAVSDVERVSRD